MLLEPVDGLLGGIAEVRVTAASRWSVTGELLRIILPGTQAARSPPLAADGLTRGAIGGAAGAARALAGGLGHAAEAGVQGRGEGLREEDAELGGAGSSERDLEAAAQPASAVAPAANGAAEPGMAMRDGAPSMGSSCRSASTEASAAHAAQGAEVECAAANANASSVRQSATEEAAQASSSSGACCAAIESHTADEPGPSFEAAAICVVGPSAGFKYHGPAAAPDTDAGARAASEPAIADVSSTRQGVAEACSDLDGSCVSEGDNLTLRQDAALHGFGQLNGTGAADVGHACAPGGSQAPGGNACSGVAAGEGSLAAAAQTPACAQGSPPAAASACAQLPAAARQCVTQSSGSDGAPAPAARAPAAAQERAAGPAPAPSYMLLDVDVKGLASKFEEAGGSGAAVSPSSASHGHAQAGGALPGAEAAPGASGGSGRAGPARAEGRGGAHAAAPPWPQVGRSEPSPQAAGSAGFVAGTRASAAVVAEQRRAPGAAPEEAPEDTLFPALHGRLVGAGDGGSQQQAHGRLLSRRGASELCSRLWCSLGFDADAALWLGVILGLAGTLAHGLWLLFGRMPW